MPWRVYRPAIVVGHSETGAMDKVDGPYYFFPLMKRMRDNLPGWLPLVGVDLGDTNVVPVDYVAKAMDHLAPPARPRRRGVPPGQPRPAAGRRHGQRVLQGGRRADVRDARRPAAPPPGRWRSSRGAAAARRWPTASSGPSPAQAAARPDRRPARHPGRGAGAHRRSPRVFDSRRTEKALAGSGIAVPDLEGYAADPVGLLGGEPRRAPPAATPQPRGAQGQVRRHHRRLLRHRPGHRAQGRPGRRHPGAGRPRQGQARGDPGHDRAARRHGPRLPVRPLRPRGDRRAVRADHHRAAGGRLRGQQRRPVDPPLAEALARPVPRLRAHDAAQLLRRDPAGHGADPDDARAEARPRRQHQLDRRADQPAAVLGVRRLQGRARLVEQRRRRPSWSATASPSPASTCRWCGRR